MIAFLSTAYGECSKHSTRISSAVSSIYPSPMSSRPSVFLYRVFLSFLPSTPNISRPINTYIAYLTIPLKTIYSTRLLTSAFPKKKTEKKRAKQTKQTNRDSFHSQDSIHPSIHPPQAPQKKKKKKENGLGIKREKGRGGITGKCPSHP